MKEDAKEFDGKELAPQCALNKNNIHTWQKAILDVYKSKKNSLFSAIADSPYWGIMHDGISMFNTEFIGVYMREVHPDTYKLVLVPYCLRKMKGGITVYEQVEPFFEMSSLHIILKENAFENISRHLLNYTNATPTPLSYFKLGTVTEVTSYQIDIKMLKNLQVGNCGDGVSIYNKAMCLVNELYGINALDFRCSARAWDGSLKCI